jgi:hypothetical protein
VGTQRTTTDEETGYGLGFEVHPSPFGLFVGHTGAVAGGTAALLIHVKTGTVLALTTNLGYATALSPPPPEAGHPRPAEAVVAVHPPLTSASAMRSINRPLPRLAIVCISPR